MERVPDFNAGDELTTKVIHQMARAIQELQKLAIMHVESPLMRANQTLLCHVPPPIQVFVHNASGEDRLRGEVLGIDDTTVDPATDADEFQERPVRVEGITPADPDHVGKFVVLLEDIEDDGSGMALVSGPVGMQVDGSAAFADVSDADPTCLLAAEKGSARVLWRAEGEGKQWAYVLLGTGGTGPKICTSDAWGGLGPYGADGAADATPEEGDTVGDVVSGTGHMFNEDIDWGDPPAEEDMLTPEEGGTWNPMVSMNLGKWLRDNWIPANDAAIVTALGDELVTFITTNINLADIIETYMTEHAGDVVGPAIEAWLIGNYSTVVMDLVNDVQANLSGWFCMDEVAPVAADATGDGTNAKHFRIDGHMHTDGGVLNPHEYLDFEKVVCTGVVPGAEGTTATDGTGGDVAGDFIFGGWNFWDSTATLFNPSVVMHPESVFWISVPDGDGLVPGGTRFIKGTMCRDPGGTGKLRPVTPFPDGDETWINIVDSEISHIGPGAATKQYLCGTSGSIIGIRTDAVNHTVQVFDSSDNQWHTLGAI